MLFLCQINTAKIHCNLIHTSAYRLAVNGIFTAVNIYFCIGFCNHRFTVCSIGDAVEYTCNYVTCIIRRIKYDIYAVFFTESCTVYIFCRIKIKLFAIINKRRFKTDDKAVFGYFKAVVFVLYGRIDCSLESYTHLIACADWKVILILKEIGKRKFRIRFIFRVHKEISCAFSYNRTVKGFFGDFNEHIINSNNTIKVIMLTNFILKAADFCVSYVSLILLFTDVDCNIAVGFVFTLDYYVCIFRRNNSTLTWEVFNDICTSAKGKCHILRNFKSINCDCKTVCSNFSITRNI